MAEVVVERLTQTDEREYVPEDGETEEPTDEQGDGFSRRFR